MKHLRETFTDEEWEELKKNKGKRSWHQYIMSLAGGILVDTNPDYYVLRVKVGEPKTGKLDYVEKWVELDKST